MKLAIITSFPDDIGAPVGGVEAVSANLVQALAEFDDLDIHVITTRQACTSSGTKRWGKVIVHRLPWAGGSTLRNAVGPGRRQIREFLEQKVKPDIIHAHDTYGLMIQDIPVPRVLTVHGFIHADTALQPGCLARPRARMWRFVELRGWSKFPHIISINPYVREKVKTATRATIHDIDNPVQVDFFSVEHQDEGNTVFFAGAITHLKNPIVILQAANLFSAERHKINIRLAGRACDPSYYRSMQDFAKQSGLEENTRFLGELNQQEIRRELSAASVFVLPSLQENAPASIGEAMAVGVPVVTSNRCGMPYMVRDGESGFLVDPNNADDIARRLGQLLKNDELRRSMGAKGKEIALDRFHPAKVAVRTREVYLRAIYDFQQK